MRNLEIKLALTPAQLAALAAAVRAAGLPVVTLRQEDTYFAVSDGRLKLRETTDEQERWAVELIAYRRPDLAGPRWSDYERLSLPVSVAPELKTMLAGVLGITTVVAKRRLVALRGRSRIHLDEVDELGCFLEIETVVPEGDDAGIDHELAATLEWLGFDLTGATPIRGSYADLRRDHER